MAASQEQRYALYDKIRDEWGDQYATAFIEIVPPMDASEIATGQDIENSTIQLRGEIAQLRGEMLHEMGKLRGDFGELRGEFQALRRHLGVTMLGGFVTIWLSVAAPLWF